MYLFLCTKCFDFVTGAVRTCTYKNESLSISPALCNTLWFIRQLLHPVGDEYIIWLGGVNICCTYIDKTRDCCYLPSSSSRRVIHSCLRVNC